jgi:hypothetical protein
MTVPPGFDTQSQPTAAAPPPVAGFPPPGAAGAKLSATWTGALLVIGAIVAGVGSFLPWEKIVIFIGGKLFGTLTLTGTGSISTTGNAQIRQLVPEPGTGGKVVIALAALLLIGGLLILAQKGRLWVSILGLVLAAVVVIVGIANLGSVSDDQKTLARTFGADNPDGVGHALSKMGIDIVIIGGGVAVVAALLAICLRRPKN